MKSSGPMSVSTQMMIFKKNLLGVTIKTQRTAMNLAKLKGPCKVLPTNNNGKVYLLGTNHYYKDSHKDVATLMRQVQPNVVFLEIGTGMEELGLILNDSFKYSASSNKVVVALLSCQAVTYSIDQ